MFPEADNADVEVDAVGGIDFILLIISFKESIVTLDLRSET
jgi:hypothetical protein